MRATRYQTGNSADIPRGILKKMVFSLDNANLPMLTWRLADGSVLQVQKTEYENVVRYWGKKVAEICYVVSYINNEDGVQRIKILNSDWKQIKDTLWANIPGSHFLKYLSGQEWKIGDLIYIKDTSNGYFYNPKSGGVLDYAFPGGDLGVANASSVLVENDTLYVVRNSTDTRLGGYLIKIRPVKNNGDYTFEETIFPFFTPVGNIQNRPVLLEEGVFYQATQVLDANYYDTVIVIDKDTGTSITKEGYLKYIDGVTVKEWFTPETYSAYISNSLSYTGTVLYPYRTATCSFNPVSYVGNIIRYDSDRGFFGGGGHFKSSLFGKNFYIEDVDVYTGSSQPVKTIEARDYNGLSVFPSITNVGPQYLLIFDGAFEWRGVKDDLFKCHIYLWDGGIRSNDTDYITWKGKQITIDDLYEKFSLSVNDHVINYMLYLPGLEKDPTIAALLK